jgi:hypothetical protein
MTAEGDLTAAYLAAAAAAGGAALPGSIGGGPPYAPGVYKATSSLEINGDITLDGGGDANAVWIFQIGTTLITASGVNVNLTGSAQSKNVYWQVGSSATLGTNTNFAGDIMAQQSVTLTTGATLSGRALALIGAVTMDTNAITVPACP